MPSLKTLHLNQATIKEIQMELRRRDFYEFRKYRAQMLNQPFYDGWWQQMVSIELQKFYEDYEKGLRPKLMINTPPQHGKSRIVTDFLCWISGRNPRLKTIFSSYSDSLGVRTNSELQKTMLHPEWEDLFPLTTMGSEKVHGSRPKRNSSLIEFNAFGGSFRNTTVGGKITGESLDLGVIDDIIKGREEAYSETTRQKKWDWFKTDFFSRFSDQAGFIAIGTLWHVEDPLMKLKEHFSDMKVISFPAIATQDEEYRKKGEALFPEFKSLEFLLERKRLYTEDEWQALYQQDPMIQGGNKFKITMYDVVNAPTAEECDYTFVVVDSSYKAEIHNDYTVFTLFGIKDGRLYILDVWRDRIEAADVEKPLEEFLLKNYTFNMRRLWVEPKGHGIYLSQQFRKHKQLAHLVPSEKEIKDFFKDRRMGKVERANNAIPHLTNKKLYFSERLNNIDDLTSELLKFPNDKHDDFVDTVVDGIKAAYSKEETIFDIMARMDQ